MEKLALNLGSRTVKDKKPQKTPSLAAWVHWPSSTWLPGPLPLWLHAPGLEPPPQVPVCDISKGGRGHSTWVLHLGPLWEQKDKAGCGPGLDARILSGPQFSLGAQGSWLLPLRGSTVMGDGGGQAQCQGAARLKWGSWGAGSPHSFELDTMVPPQRAEHLPGSWDDGG